jgi:hypothetical protein
MKNKGWRWFVAGMSGVIFAAVICSLFRPMLASIAHIGGMSDNLALAMVVLGIGAWAFGSLIVEHLLRSRRPV